MATGGSQTLALTCPGCGARFRVGGELAGKRGRCAKCGHEFRVPKSASKTLPTVVPPPIVIPPMREPEAAPQYIGVQCRVCQTLMYGLANQVGTPIKCPDCGAETLVPKPKPAKPKKPLAAMEGDQYEVWGVDEAPSVDEMLAAQPKYIAVQCALCQTLMHATVDQVGTKLKCPDCGTLSVVPSPEAVKPVRNVLTRDEDDVLIDVSLDPGERPAAIVLPRRPMLYEEEADAERMRQEAKAARGDRSGPQYDRRGRPVMPRWPLVTRVLPFLFTGGVIVRWVVLSIGLFFSGGIAAGGISMAGSGGFGAIGGMSFLAMGVMVFAIWLMAISGIFITIVTESSEGNDTIQQWPAPIMSEWIGELLYMLMAGFVSPCPGWLVGRYLVAGPLERVPIFLGSVLIFFPIVLLSQLDVGSMFGIASPRVLASLVRLPGTWLLFYLELAALAAFCLGATIVISENVPVLNFLLIPLYVAAVLLVARLIGRLGWKLAESWPANDADKSE